MKTEILKLLRESDDYISGQELCERFQVSRTAVWKVINQLKEEGYRIEAVRNKGYHIVDCPDIMSREEIESQMNTKWAGKTVAYFAVTDSTNNQAKMLGDQGAPHGLLAVADMQKAGKAWPCMGITKRCKHLYVHLAAAVHCTLCRSTADTGDGL